MIVLFYDHFISLNSKLTLLEEIKKIIKDHEDRISKLEKQFSSKSVQSTSKKTQSVKPNYSGTKNTLEFLITSGFLATPKSSRMVCEEMKREGHNKPVKNIDTTLRSFVQKKTLERIKEEKIWKYVVRKTS